MPAPQTIKWSRMSDNNDSNKQAMAIETEKHCQREGRVRGPRRSQPASLPHEAFSSSPRWRAAHEPLMSFRRRWAAPWGVCPFRCHYTRLPIPPRWEPPEALHCHLCPLAPRRPGEAGCSCPGEPRGGGTASRAGTGSLAQLCFPPQWWFSNAWASSGSSTGPSFSSPRP